MADQIFDHEKLDVYGLSIEYAWSGVTGRVLMESQLTPPTEPWRSGPEVIGTGFDVDRDSCSCSAQRCSCS